MSQKGKSVAVSRVSGTAPTAARGPKYRSYEGLRERFRIGNEYDIVLAKEEESYLVNKPGCLILSLDLLEVGFRLPLPEVARALLNTWGVAPIQLTPNSWRTICVFCIVCKLRGVRGLAEVFREQFTLASSPLSRESIYYTNHHLNRMQIHFGKKHSNNKGWMHRIFFVGHREDAPEWGFPTRVRTPRKDSYPFLIQDKARASDSLNLASVRNTEDYLTEFQLVQHGLSRPWDTEELATGRDQKAMENYVEQIAMTSCLRKSGAKVVSKKAAQPVAEEEAEEVEEEEEVVEQLRPQAVIETRPLSKEGIFSELGLVVVSDQSDESSSEERVGASMSQGPIAGRTKAVAAAGASSTVAAEQTVAAGEAVTAQGSTSDGANEAVRAVEVPKGATVPIPPVKEAVEVPTQIAAVGSHEAEHTVETEEGGPRGSPAVAGDQELTAAAGATDAVREEVPSVGQTNAADEGRAGSEEDHLPLMQSLKEKAPLQPSASFLEATLERLQEGPSRGLPPCSSASHLEVLAWCQGRGPEDAPECSKEVYQEQRVDDDESVDVEALVDGVPHSLGVLKRLALRAQNHQQMWYVEFTFFKELQA
ncbi:hypothetical protein Taro_002896 [Colocasia esculenta]|uniref:Transposase (putative) gypsy type domain-containing protein n=1 Tax=Colocasia esculenta TaxID=4460 RepID=A0A843TM65_COLES|nr:hypothetical protein [Colocasia esculenta]